MKFIVAILLVILLIVVQILKKKSKISCKKATYLSIFLAVLFLEFTIFNINSYRTDFGKITKKEYTNTDLEKVISVTDDRKYFNITSKLKL